MGIPNTGSSAARHVPVPHAGAGQREQNAPGHDGEKDEGEPDAAGRGASGHAAAQIHCRQHPEENNLTTLVKHGIRPPPQYPASSKMFPVLTASGTQAKINFSAAERGEYSGGRPGSAQPEKRRKITNRQQAQKIHEEDRNGTCTSVQHAERHVQQSRSYLCTLGCIQENDHFDATHAAWPSLPLAPSQLTCGRIRGRSPIAVPHAAWPSLSLAPSQSTCGRTCEVRFSLPTRLH